MHNRTDTMIFGNKLIIFSFVILIGQIPVACFDIKRGGKIVVWLCETAQSYSYSGLTQCSEICFLT